MMRARSSACWCSSANHFISTAARSLAALARQAGQALWAAAMAASVSAAPRLATAARCWPVAGSSTSKRASPVTQSPPISASVFSRLASFSADSGELFVSMVVFVSAQFDQLNAAMPVMARPRISAWMSCVPS